MYDELVVRDPRGEGPLVRCHLDGNINVFRGDGADSSYAWEDYLRSDPRAFLTRMEAAAGLAPPPTMPASTNRTIVYRVLAELMARPILTLYEVTLVNGFFDSSGEESEPREWLFDQFPEIGARHRASRPGDFLDRGEYRFWFLLHNNTPTADFEVDDGLTWLRGSLDQLDLGHRYATTGRNLNVLLAQFDSWRHGSMSLGK